MSPKPNLLINLKLGPDTVTRAFHLQPQSDGCILVTPEIGPSALIRPGDSVTIEWLIVMALEDA